MRNRSECHTHIPATAAVEVVLPSAALPWTVYYILTHADHPRVLLLAFLHSAGPDSEELVHQAGKGFGSLLDEC